MGVAELSQLAVTHGLGVVLSIIVIGCLIWVLRYVLKANSAREERLAMIIENHLTKLDVKLGEHDTRAIAAIRSMEEASKYQRQEHEKMMEILNKMVVQLTYIHDTTMSNKQLG